MPRWPERTDKERFFEKVEQPANGVACWVWIGACGSNGYGNFFHESRVQPSHRASWKLFKRDEIGEMCVLHKCDNPRCVNPEHLFLGTKLDNNLDKMRKGRHTWAEKTHCIRNHPLSGDNLYVSMTTGARICRECLRIRETARRTTTNARRSDYGTRRVAPCL